MWCPCLVLVVAFLAGHGQARRSIDRYYHVKKQEVLAISVSGQFRGVTDVTRKDRYFESYRGIRYAEPPVGRLRFKPPKLILNYPDIVNATVDGPVCPQPVDLMTYVHEDCLTINVYTPLKKSRLKLLPVIMYIHSGGFYSGSGRSDMAGPHYLLDRDLVLVTINYRLGSLGFLSTGDALAPGNNGFKDQVAALRWVQRNIDGFGGDPNSVTITGCSAGASSVMLHMISPMSKGLFHRAISMSWSPVDKALLGSDLFPLAVKQAQLLNCPANNSRVIINCLMTKTWSEIGDSLESFQNMAYDPVGIWLPIVENDFGQERFLTMQPLDAIRQNKMHAVPYIISQTQDEFYWKAYSVLQAENTSILHQMNEDWENIAPISFMLPLENRRTAVRRLRQEYLLNWPLVNDEISADWLGKLYGDSIIGFSVHRLAKLMSIHSPQPVWYYLFAYIGKNSHYSDERTGKINGVAHHDDLIYLFSLRLIFPDIGLTGPDSDLVSRMTGIWYYFAKYGDPNRSSELPELQDINWPSMKPDDRVCLRIDEEFTLGRNIKEDRFQVWDELYPIEY